MSLQNVFYIMAIVYMTIGVLILIGIAVLLFYIKSKVISIAKQIEEQLTIVSSVATHTMDTAANLGAFVADKTVSKVKALRKKKKK